MSELNLLNEYVTKKNCKEWRETIEKELERVRFDVHSVRNCIDTKLNKITNVLFTILGGLVISLIVLVLNLVFNTFGHGVK